MINFKLNSYTVTPAMLFHVFSNIFLLRKLMFQFIAQVRREYG